MVEEEGQEVEVEGLQAEEVVVALEVEEEEAVVLVEEVQGVAEEEVAEDEAVSKVLGKEQNAFNHPHFSNLFVCKSFHNIVNLNVFVKKLHRH